MAQCHDQGSELSTNNGRASVRSKSLSSEGVGFKRSTPWKATKASHKSRDRKDSLLFGIHHKDDHVSTFHCPLSVLLSSFDIHRAGAMIFM